MSLSACLKKAGSALATEDRAAILMAARDFRQKGATPTEAAIRAVEAQIEAVRQLIEAARPSKQEKKPAEPAAPSITWVRNDSGTIAVTGDPEAIAKLLEAAGVTRVMKAKNGALVAKSEADKAEAALKKTQPKPAKPPKAASPLRLGITPNSADPVTVKDGVVFVGKYAAQNFDTGEDVTVPDGATTADIRKALTDAGAVPRRAKFFGGQDAKPDDDFNATMMAMSRTPDPNQLDLMGESEAEPVLTAPTREEVLDQQRRREEGEKAEAKRKAAEQAKLKAEQERKDIAEASKAAAGTFELGGDAVQNLSGQTDLLAEPPAAAPAAPTGKIEDFGEKLPPARRAMAAKLSEDLSDDDIASKPLSEIWPLAENDGIEDTFAAAVAHAARAEVPAKPRTAYKVKRWVETVKTVRTLAATIVSGKVSRERIIQEVSATRRTLRDWLAKVLLLEQLPRDQWSRIGAVEERPESFTYQDGKQVPMPTLRLNIDDKAHFLRGDGTVAGNMAEIRTLLGDAAPEKRIEFEIRSPRSGGKYFVNKKGDGEYRALMEFTTLSEARAAIKDDYAGLVAAWDAIKARDNITERDLRSAENRPRAGKDWRNGKDVTPEQFQTQFGFRGGEFGKWVQQGKGDKERQALLNSAYDALMDLSEIVGIPPRAIALNGTLGIAFGSRGAGWASAHFEPSNLVINLTKTRGAGALAHEWFHALDNYFSRLRGGEKPFTGDQKKYRAENYITHKPEPLMVRKDGAGYFGALTVGRLEALRRANPTAVQYAAEKWHPDPKHPAGVRPEVERRFAELVRTLDESPMTKRATTLDKSGSGYWSSTLERAARAFENYVQARMMEDGYHNDFLANVQPVENTGRNPDRYPYLLPGEVKPIAEAFGALFDTIETKETDAGVAMFARGERDSVAILADIDRLGKRVLDLEDAIGQAGKELRSLREHGKRQKDKVLVAERVGEKEQEIADIEKALAKTRRELAAAEREEKAIKPLDDVRNQQSLFRRDSDPMPSGMTMEQARERAAQMRGRFTKAEAQKIVDGLTAKWKDGPQVHVVATAAESMALAKQLGIDIEVPGDARGFYVKGHVFVIANAHPKTGGRKAIGRTLAHEAIAHHGLREMLGKQDWERLMAMIQMANKRKNPAMMAALAEVQKNYREKDGSYTFEGRPNLEADEMAARVVESAIDDNGNYRPGYSFLKSVYAKIRQFLRDLGLDIEFTDADLQGMLVAAQRNLEAGKRTAGRGSMAVAPTAARQRDPSYLRVFHGTPHEVDKFSTEKIGTGEGHQAYGWGLYFASKREIADYYRKTLASNRLSYSIEGKQFADTTWLRDTGVEEGWFRNWVAEAIADGRATAGDALNGSATDAIYRLMQKMRQAGDTKKAAALDRLMKAVEAGAVKAERVKGRLYEVEIPEEGQYLLWDRPLSDLPQKYQQAIYDGLIDAGAAKGEINHLLNNKTGADLYRYMSDNASHAQRHGTKTFADIAKFGGRGDEAASKFLRSLGIRGIKYLDGSSRHRPLRDVKREFLAELPEDAGFDEVLDLIGSGTFSPANETILKALAADDWLGFDYPAQAISAALGGKIENYDASPALVKAVADAQDGGTYNYVVFSDSDVEVKAMFARDGTPRTIEVDGKRYPAENSLGQPIHPTFQGQQNFWRWAKGTKVVDDKGRPLVVYHGTNKSFDSFDPNAHRTALPLTGMFFSPHPEVASAYAGVGLSGVFDDELPAGAQGANVLPVYLSLKNPVRLNYTDRERGGLTNWKIVEADIQKAIKAGHDGAIIQGWADGSGPVQYVAFSPTQIKSATGNRGTFDGKDGNIMFARGGGLFTPQPWSAPEPTRTDNVIYELQDSRVDLKRVQQAIQKVTGAIAEQFDARQAETLYPGRVARRNETFLKAEVQPMLEAMARAKIDMTEMGDYLLARHAQDRNRVIAQRNPNLPDGGAGTNSQGDLMTNAAAAAYLAAIPTARRAQLDAVAAHVDRITAGTRALLVSEGLEKQATVNGWAQVFGPHYVPLFKDEAEAGGHPHPIGAGFTVRGPASKHATGSTGEVLNVLAHVLMQREAAITRGEKNRVGLALYGLALSNPNPDFWTTIKPNMTNAQIGQELQAMGVNPTVAVAGMQMVPTIRDLDPITGKVVDRPNPIYKSLPGAITLKVNGDDRVLMLNVKDPRAERMAVALKNLDGLTAFDLAGTIVGKATRWLAAVNTQYNPAFGLVNLTRDTWGGLVNLGSTPLRGKGLLTLARVPLAMQGIARELMGGGASSQWAQLWKQFQDDGGRTGWRDVFAKADERAEAIERELAAAHRIGKLTPGRLAHAALSLLDGFNTTLENAVRLAAYKTALDQGMSRAAGAKLGRELTVDFNRKGRIGRELGPMYAFFNASVQGAARTIETLKGPTGAKIIAGGLTLGMLQALILMAAGYDDDEIPEFVKTRALIIPLPPKEDGEKRFLSIPYPLGLHVIPNTGRVLTELSLNGGKDIGKRTVSAIGEVMGAFNPLGGGNVLTAHGALTTIAPTLVDPVIDIASNKNFAGMPIERESPRGETDNRPGYERAREGTLRSTTGQAYLGISRAFNSLTGGNAYEAGAASPTPERVRYIAQTVGGGVLRELEKTIDASVRAANGEKVKSSGIPVVGRFYGEVDADRVTAARYFKKTRELDKLQTSLAAAKKAGDGEAMVRLVEQHPELALASAQDKIQQRLAKLNRLAVTTVSDPEQMKAIDEARTAEMRAFNEALQELEAGNAKPTLGDKVRGIVKPKEVAAAP